MRYRITLPDGSQVCMRTNGCFVVEAGKPYTHLWGLNFAVVRDGLEHDGCVVESFEEGVPMPLRKGPKDV